MSARTRSIALDGRSVDAAAAQTKARVSAVQASIIRVFRECGPLTLDALEDAYAALVAAGGDVPNASPQSVRSRAAELKHRGILRMTTLTGRSRYGRPASVLALAETAENASRLW